MKVLHPLKSSLIAGLLVFALFSCSKTEDVQPGTSGTLEDNKSITSSKAAVCTPQRFPYNETLTNVLYYIYVPCANEEAILDLTGNFKGQSVISGSCNYSSVSKASWGGTAVGQTSGHTYLISATGSDNMKGNWQGSANRSDVMKGTATWTITNQNTGQTNTLTSDYKMVVTGEGKVILGRFSDFACQ